MFAAPDMASAKSERASKIERVKLFKQEAKDHEAALRFLHGPDRKWRLHLRQMDVPCWEVRLAGPERVCAEARTNLRIRSRKLSNLRAEIAKLEAELLPVGNIRHWLCIHRYEKDPDQGWATNTGNGYYGGLQMDIDFQRAYGPKVLGFPDAETMFKKKGTANKWAPREQMAVAEYARRSGRGYYPWPNTARYCGLI